MSVSRAEIRALSGDSRYLAQLKNAASRITDERLKTSIMKLLLRLKAQSGIGSLNKKIEILKMLTGLINTMESDDTVKSFFKNVLSRYMADLKQRSNNPVGWGMDFIAVVESFYSEPKVVTEDMQYNGESFYWMFNNQVYKWENGTYGTELGPTLPTKKLFLVVMKSFVREAIISLQNIDLKDFKKKLNLLIQDIENFKEGDEFGMMYTLTEPENGALDKVIAQAKQLGAKCTVYMYEHEEAKKEAEDNLRLPKHIRGRIKDFIGLKLRF